MIVINFFNIKNTNGLLFYGLDYLSANSTIVRHILVRPSLEKKIKELAPNFNIISCSIYGYIGQLIIATMRGDLLFTPTSHPVPFIDRQWIVIHDAYPFREGKWSLFKRILIRLSLATSKCIVAYINRSDAMPFIRSLGVSPTRMQFAPNRFPPPLDLAKSAKVLSGITTVGLLGTDSAKKNYHKLFNAVLQSDFCSTLAFRIYGHDTAYFRGLVAQFPAIKMELAKSDDETLENFMSSVDVLASAAEQEGFGRPIASALLAGLPVELLDRPVFREFFSGGANFHSDITTLVKALPRTANADTEQKKGYMAPPEVVAAYAAANKEIHRLGSAKQV